MSSALTAPSPAVPPRIGRLRPGPRNAITDVAGITVGHATLADGPIQTGVTVILPHDGDPFRERVPAAAHVLNGFGKSFGLLQLEELGVIETPIALTNTFSVPAVAAAQIRATIAANPKCGRSLPSVNPLVLECNDGTLNDIQALAIGDDHYRDAIASAGPSVPQGAVGAGRGMSCFGVKGGIGTASRIATLANSATATVGALVLANFGRPDQLIVAGQSWGERLAERLRGGRRGEEADAPEKGSIIMVLATDAALDSRQLRRLAARAGAGLARTGSVYGHGSGDIALAISTAYRLPLDRLAEMPAVRFVADGLLDPLFQAAADVVEQAILNTLWAAEAVTGRGGNRRRPLLDLLPELESPP
jgi:D-aminopeptidase